jgi:hypothetical protein
MNRRACGVRCPVSVVPYHDEGVVGLERELGEEGDGVLEGAGLVAVALGQVADARHGLGVLGDHQHLEPEVHPHVLDQRPLV